MGGVGYGSGSNNYLYVRNSDGRIDIQGSTGVFINSDTDISGDLDVDGDVQVGTQNGTVKIGGSETALGLTIDYNQSSATTTSITSNPSYTNASALMILRVDGDSSSTANQLVLKGDGNVGIGTNSPNAKLHVYGSGTTYATIQAGGGLYAYLRLQTPSSGDGYLIKNTTTGNSLLDKSLYLWNSNGPIQFVQTCLLYTSPSPRDRTRSRMPSSA